ncbi:MAG: histidinol-phosphatase HisJ family protein [Pedosphaera sp.]|nr:histidinol-phosphatase HisJ family protein [Pedosphaera sp.]
MKLPPDYHMHTPLCRHARGEPVEYARRALEVGLTEIGFSDHSPMRRDDFDDWRMRNDQLDEYVEKVRKAQREFPQLTIRLALEVDYLPGHEDWIRDLAARHPWDYFIGSVHYVSDTWAVDSPYKLSEWKNRDAFEVWSVYFERLTMAAETGLFEIIGHADLPKKFGHRPTRDPAFAGGFGAASCTPLYEKFLTAAKQHNCAIELNTAGLRKDCREIYPSREILQLAFNKGVPITFGSDAHAPEEVGMNFAEAIQLAREVGYTECCRFAGRKREAVQF